MSVTELTPVESFWLRWHAEHSPEPAAQRARITLLADSGAPPAAIASALGIRETEAALALMHFARQGLSDFPRPSLSLDELLSAARVDMAHARHVAGLSLALFDFTRSLHRLPKSLRSILETAALLHNLGVTVDEPQHHIAGRDLLRGMELAGCAGPQQRTIACLVAFHRKKVRPDQEDYFNALSPARQRHTLALAALLRVADGLDYSQSQSTLLHGAVIAPEAVTLRLSGPQAEQDAARARKKADLWRAVFHLALETAWAPQPVDLERLASTPLGPDTPMSDAARRTLALLLLRWQASESGALAGDVAAVTAARAAARRLCVALELLGGYFKRRPVKRLIRRLQKVEALLGHMGEVDMSLADALAYQARLPQETAAELSPLTAAWDKERLRALADVKAWLGGPEAADLHTALIEFIIIVPERKRGAEPLRTGAGQALRAALADVAERQAALARDKPRSYHRMWLAIRRLRYALEFFSAALPPDAGELIADLIRMQDRLGALSDARFLNRRLAGFLDEWAEQQAKRKAPQLFGAQGILRYARARREGWGQLVKSLNQDWAPVRAARLRRRVNALLRALKGRAG